MYRLSMQTFAVSGCAKRVAAYMTRGYTARIEATENEWRAACEHHGDDDILFVAQRGGKQVVRQAIARWGWLLEETDRQKGKWAMAKVVAALADGVADSRRPDHRPGNAPRGSN